MPEWYAVQTKPHKEFMVRDALARLDGVDPYLPELHVKPINPRARKVRPFFPGYLFVRADLDRVGLSAVQWTPGLARLLGADGQPLPIAEHVIQAIRRRLVEVQGQVTRGGGLYETGDRVRVTAGPFEGYEGMFDTRIGGSMRARILVEFLSRLTPAEIDVRNLEKVSRRRF